MCHIDLPYFFRSCFDPSPSSWTGANTGLRGDWMRLCFPSLHGQSQEEGAFIEHLLSDPCGG